MSKTLPPGRVACSQSDASQELRYVAVLTYIDAWTQEGTPVHSNTASTSPTAPPLTFEIFAISAAVSFAMSRFSSIVCPRFSGTVKLRCAKLFSTAKFTRPESMSAITTVLAPDIFAIAATNSPTAPAPNTKTVAPTGSCALLVAWIATPSGSRRAPRSSETFSGSLPMSVLMHFEVAFHSLVTPRRGVVNPILQRSLGVGKGFCATSELHLFADIIPPLFTPVALFARLPHL
jgi:hypothetical protein